MNTKLTTSPLPALDLSRWRQWPLWLFAGGGVLSAVGWALDSRQFAFSYLTAFMFFLSICLGSLFLVLMHHLFDSQWMVPLRRCWEHLACLLPLMGILFIPLALQSLMASPANALYGWMNANPATDHELHAKYLLYNRPAFVVAAVVIFGLWGLLSFRLRHWSLVQDHTGDAQCTRRMRRWSALGVWLFALTVTLGSFYWMKALEYQFFSTMYGVYYFAASMWVTIPTSYLLALVLKRAGPLKEIVQVRTFHDLGMLFLTFTVFYAYIHFSQYFLIWNASIPEETFWYVKREQGTWWIVGQVIIFGHFLLPFLALLRIDAKLSLTLMVPLCVWAWLMHYNEMTFNIKPVLNGQGVPWHWLDVTTFAFIGGALALGFMRSFRKYPPFPLRDPRIAETMGVYVAPRGLTQQTLSPVPGEPGTSPKSYGNGH